MATIKFNGITSPSGMVTFDRVPSILTVAEDYYGTYAFVRLIVGTGITQPTSDGQYRITVMGDTVTNVLSQDNETGKRFKVYADRSATAASIASALRDCQQLVAQFKIYASGTNVNLLSRTMGSIGVTASSNMVGLTASYNDGTIYSGLLGCKVRCDIYTDGDYKTTLEKRMHGDECSFDLSRVLAPYSTFGSLTPYSATVTTVDTSGVFVDVGNVSGYTTPGYLNQGSEPYLYCTSSPQLLLNRRDGLTVYGDALQFSVLSNAGFTYRYNVLKPDGTVLEETTANVTSSGLTDIFANLSDDALISGSVISLSAGTDTAEFRIIKPLKAADGYERICWRNEYGGISFFDFTGGDALSLNLEKKQYDKTMLDFYEEENFQHKKMMDAGTYKTVTMTSHLLTKDEAMQLLSLAKAEDVWMQRKEQDEVTGRFLLSELQEHVIISSVEVSKNDTYTNVYTAKIKFSYSIDR